MIWLAANWKKLALALIAMFLFLFGWNYAKVSDTAKQAKTEVKAQKQVIHRAKVRSDVEQQTAQLPDAPVQRIGDADPDTAAGRLFVWTRD